MGHCSQDNPTILISLAARLSAFLQLRCPGIPQNQLCHILRDHKSEDRRRSTEYRNSAGCSHVGATEQRACMWLCARTYVTTHGPTQAPAHLRIYIHTETEHDSTWGNCLSPFEIKTLKEVSTRPQKSLSIGPEKSSC